MVFQPQTSEKCHSSEKLCQAASRKQQGGPMKFSQHTKTFIIVLFFFSLGISPVSNAAGKLLPPQKVINDTSNKLKEKLQDESFANDRKKVSQFIDKEIFTYVDFYRMLMGNPCAWRIFTYSNNECFNY